MEPRIARRAVAVALIAGLAADILFDGTPLGLNVPLATIALIALVALVALVAWFSPRHGPADQLDWWLPALAAAASIGPAIRTDPSVVALDAWLVIAAVSGWAVAASGAAVTRRSAAAVAQLGALAAAGIAGGMLWLPAR